MYQNGHRDGYYKNDSPMCDAAEVWISLLAAEEYGLHSASKGMISEENINLSDAVKTCFLLLFFGGFTLIWSRSKTYQVF